MGSEIITSTFSGSSTWTCVENTIMKYMSSFFLSLSLPSLPPPYIHPSLFISLPHPHLTPFFSTYSSFLECLTNHMYIWIWHPTNEKQEELHHHFSHVKYSLIGRPEIRIFCMYNLQYAVVIQLHTPGHSKLFHVTQEKRAMLTKLGVAWHTRLGVAWHTRLAYRWLQMWPYKIGL